MAVTINPAVSGKPPNIPNRKPQPPTTIPNRNYSIHVSWKVLYLGAGADLSCVLMNMIVTGCFIRHVHQHTREIGAM